MVKNKVYNKSTKRWVLKNGLIGKQILKNKRKIKNKKKGGATPINSSTECVHSVDLVTQNPLEPPITSFCPRSHCFDIETYWGMLNSNRTTGLPMNCPACRLPLNVTELFNFLQLHSQQHISDAQTAITDANTKIKKQIEIMTQIDIHRSRLLHPPPQSDLMDVSDL